MHSPYFNVIIIDNDNKMKGMRQLQLHYGLEELKEIDWTVVLPILMPFIAVALVLIVVALIDLYRHRKTQDHVLFWMIIILVCNTIGPILYFTIGRKGGAAR
jgi:Phospholipase_D-nuclease N-terminal